jgi:hypothetical protein
MSVEESGNVIVYCAEFPLTNACVSRVFPLVSLP